MKRIDWELRNQEHQMDAEGCQDKKPTVREIVVALKSEGYRPRNLNVSFDTMQNVWRWNCGILKIG